MEGRAARGGRRAEVLAERREVVIIGVVGDGGVPRRAPRMRQRALDAVDELDSLVRACDGADQGGNLEAVPRARVEDGRGLEACRVVDDDRSRPRRRRGERTRRRRRELTGMPI